MEAGAIVARRWQLLAEAGQGGMGTVYRARDLETGDLVAVKLVNDGEDRDRFAREAARLHAVAHPNVVRFLAGGLADGVPYLVMSWIDGAPLTARLADPGLSVAETLALGARVGEALGALHRAGMIHRDLKPANLLLPGGALERVTLIDFGVARAIDDSRVLTRTGMLVGTPQYMSPEQARGDRALDPRSDVFALGCVVYECATGVPAFGGEHPAAVLAKILTGDPPALGDACPEAPPELAALLARMLARDPAARPSDGAAAARALAAIACPPGPRRPSGHLDAEPTARPGRPAAGFSAHVEVAGATTVHALPATGAVVIGRGPAADLRIDHPSVSTAHARLVLGSIVTVEDLGSKNGTRCAGELVPRGAAHEVALGAPVQLGAAVLRLARVGA